MITFDPNKLTTAEVELLELTITEQMAPYRKVVGLPPRIYMLGDISAAFRAMAGDEVPNAPSMGVVLRAIELLDLRKSNPAATWEETGSQNLVAEVETPDVMTPDSQWPSPTLTTPA